MKIIKEGWCVYCERRLGLGDSCYYGTRTSSFFILKENAIKEAEKQNRVYKTNTYKVRKVALFDMEEGENSNENG